MNTQSSSCLFNPRNNILSIFLHRKRINIRFNWLIHLILLYVFNYLSNELSLEMRHLARRLCGDSPETKRLVQSGFITNLLFRYPSCSALLFSIEVGLTIFLFWPFGLPPSTAYKFKSSPLLFFGRKLFTQSITTSASGTMRNPCVTHL